MRGLELVFAKSHLLTLFGYRYFLQNRDEKAITHLRGHSFRLGPWNTWYSEHSTHRTLSIIIRSLKNRAARVTVTKL